MSDNVIDRFEAWLIETDKSAKTVKNYTADVRQFADWCAGKGILFNAGDIISRDLIQFREYLQRDRKPATVNRKIVSLKQFFAWATDQQLISRDPARPVKLVKQEANAPKHLSEREEKALIRAVEKYGTVRDRTIIVLMLNTGLRAAEVCGLLKRDVEINPRSGSVMVRSGKGNKARQIPLNVTARAALTEYFEKEPHEADYLFPAIRGNRPLDVRGLGYLLEKYSRFANISKITPHDLRHRFAYQTNKQAGLEITRRLLGHKNIQTTTIYTEPTFDDLQQAVDRIDWN